MSDPVPFCGRCGRPGPSLSGMHVIDDGFERWTLYRCGHVHTQVISSDEQQSQPTLS